jgi:uncharacterized protein (DUF1697 family)
MENGDGGEFAATPSDEEYGPVKYVALLRGIGPMNPNMRNERLREVVEQLGFRNVATVVSSGNIVFETDAQDVSALEAQLEDAWPTQLDFRSTTIVRSAVQIQHLMDRDPFGDRANAPGANLQVTFLKREPHVTLEIPCGPETGDFTIVGFEDRAICSVIDLTTGRTPDLMRWHERRFGKEITTRTWRTVQRIEQKMS